MHVSRACSLVPRPRIHHSGPPISIDGPRTPCKPVLRSDLTPAVCTSRLPVRVMYYMTLYPVVSYRRTKQPLLMLSSGFLHAHDVIIRRHSAV
jgi:hypothetical protein